MPYVEYDEVAASCPECGRNFRSEEDLETHLEEVHARLPTPSPGRAPVGRSRPPAKTKPASR